MIDKRILQLKPKELRIISPTGTQEGVFSFDDAVRFAETKGADLILISPKAVPPVAKLGDLKRALYEEEKKKPKQKTRELKSVKITVNESPHELSFRLKRAIEFLEKGHPVQIQMRMRGRQKIHQDFAREKLKKFMEQITVPFKYVQDIKGSPNGLTVVITK